MIFKTLAPLILASGSPRRRKFLADLGLNFQVIPARISETINQEDSPEDFVKRLSKEKSLEIAAARKSDWVIGADTVVVLDGEILGKPADPTEAGDMLGRLSNRRHQVCTGYSLLNLAEDKIVSRTCLTEVYFIKLSPGLINAYVAGGEPLDKAGAYGIQGTGGTFVRKINGSYSNVVGLPMAELLKDLLDSAVISPLP